MPIISSILYLVLCVIVGWLARDRKIGAVGYFLFSLIATPLIAFIILFATTPSNKNTTN